MSTELVSVVTAALGVVGGAVAGALAEHLRTRGMIAKLKEERRQEREHSFDQAKTGYRALYHKFAEDYGKAARSGGGFDTVRSDFHESQMVGFKPLNSALEQFWPTDRWLAGQPPSQQHWDGVVRAFGDLAGLELEEWEQLQHQGSS